MIKDPYGGWMFDLDEREALTDILKAKFDSKQIDTFLIMLEFICSQMKIWNEDLLSVKDVKLYLAPILKSIKKTTDYLSLLEKEQLAKRIPFGFPHFLGSDPHPEDKRRSRSYVDSISKSAEASRISLEELEALIEKQLQEWKMPPNRPTADSHSFVFDMARRYHQIFVKMPTTTKEGTFYQVVASVYKLVGLPSESPDRDLTIDTKNLKKQLNIFKYRKSQSAVKQGVNKVKK